MEKLIENVYEYIKENEMVSPDDGIIIGLSGGADSVCLAITLCSLSKRLGVSLNKIYGVHIHHMIRGEEADRDLCFSRQLCERLGIGFISYKKDIAAMARENGCSVEESGRNYRYECFHETAREKGCSRIAVAHNKNDLAETVIFNMVRGSGLKGLGGIMPVRDMIIRPLLNTTRNEIEEYLKEIAQDFCTDSTNGTLDYDRNRIRRIILPAMLEINSQYLEHICELAGEAKKSHAYICSQADEFLRETEDGDEISLDIGELDALDEVIKENIIQQCIFKMAGSARDITRNNIQSVLELTRLDTGKSVSLPYGLVARRNYTALNISRVGMEGELYSINISGEGVYEIPDWGSIYIDFQDYKQNTKIEKKNYTKTIDCDKIKNTLCVRTPLQGDYIKIDGGGRTKKVSRVFIDAKIDRAKRETWPVLACGQEVIWVVGLRFSEAYLVDEDTSRIMNIKYIRKGEQ